MSTWQSGDIEVNGLRMHTTRTGGAMPPVVLAHGFSDDGLCWTPVAEVLAAAYDVIMVDARGHGRSSGPERGYGFEAQVGDLAGVIEGLGLVRPAVLGHSMGAATALALAGRHPELPRAILLEDPPPWWATPARSVSDPGWQARTRARMVELKRKTRDELIAAERIASPGWSEAELGPWADAKLRFSFNVLSRDEEPARDWRQIISAITCPVLLITADPERGSLVTAEAAADLKAMLPQARIAHIAGAGHSIRREQFANYMDVVGRFLAETTV